MCRWPLPAQFFSGVVPWDLRPYFTVSDLRLPFSSPPTTRRSRRRYSTPPPHGLLMVLSFAGGFLYTLRTDNTETSFHCRVAQTTQKTSHVIAKYCWSVTSFRLRECVFTESLPRSGLHNPFVPLLVLVLLRNGCFCGSTVIAWGKYATIFSFKHVCMYVQTSAMYLYVMYMSLATQHTSDEQRKRQK
jgi:hypothetical protein